MPHASLRPVPAIVLALFTLLGCSRSELVAPPIDCPDCTVLQGAKVFDGSSFHYATVVLRGDRVEQVVDPEAFVLSGEVVDLTGTTLLPGLFDLHVHATSPTGPDSGLSGDDAVAAAFRAMLRSGVTTALDLGASEHVIFEYRRRVQDGDLLAPHLLAAGPVITPSGGHPCVAGTFPGDSCLLLDHASDVPAAMADLVPQRPDVIKLILEGGRPGVPLPVLPPEVLSAVIERGAKTGVPVFVHVSRATDIESALDAGARIFAHIPVFDELRPELAARMAAEHAVVIPTLAVRDSLVRLSSGTMAELDDPATAEDVPASELAALKDPARLGKVALPENRDRYLRESDLMHTNLRRCLNAGVTIAAGTDAGNFGVFHGLALRRELALYVQDGMPIASVLGAATRTSAELLGLHDRGRIEPGAVADLIVVRGDAEADLGVLDRVDRVILGGVALDREALTVVHAGSLVRRAATDRQEGSTCLRPGECAAGLRCDAWNRCSQDCSNGGQCPDAQICAMTVGPEPGAACTSGDGCDLFTQDCPNGTACVWSGRGVTRCSNPGTGTTGQPCDSWGMCTPGYQCLAEACRRLCLPEASTSECSQGQTCQDDSAAAGQQAGHCM